MIAKSNLYDHIIVIIRCITHVFYLQTSFPSPFLSSSSFSIVPSSFTTKRGIAHHAHSESKQKERGEAEGSQTSFRIRVKKEAGDIHQEHWREAGVIMHQEHWREVGGMHEEHWNNRKGEHWVIAQNIETWKSFLDIAVKLQSIST